MKRKMKTVSILVTLLAAAILFVGCAEVPAPDTSAAQKAYDEAVGTGAEGHAADQLTEAKAALDAMNAEIAEQAKKAGYSRKYEKTLELHNEAVAKANAARDTAAAAIAQAKSEAEAVKNEVGEIYLKVESSMTAVEACTKKPKNFESVVAPFRADWEAMKTQWTAVTSAFDSGNYAEAKSQAETMKEKVSAFDAAFEAAKGKLKGC